MPLASDKNSNNRNIDIKRKNLEENRIIRKFSNLYSSPDRAAELQRSLLPSTLQQYSSKLLSPGRKEKEKMKEQRSLLICYATAGYPDTQTTKEIVSAMVYAGADIIEIGIPFSDPLADGPLIQEATYIALSKGMTPNKSLQIVKDIRSRFSEVPIILMTYSNVLVKAGIGDFIKKARQSGADGFILPDMPIEESREYISESAQQNLTTIFLVSPNTKEERLRDIASKSSGFLYLISTYGTTGIRSSFDPSTASYIRNTKRMVASFSSSSSSSSLPIAVGFGISKPEHAKSMIDAGADAIIVASAITNIIRLYTLRKKENKKMMRKEMLKEIYDFVSAMKSACM
ncbi:MAG TPA: tryptophan synthase subunit alpha [Nitrososphaera sp.]|nr:tryptophan synthase subunit alpha [Nitrososphaera sp.]